MRKLASLDLRGVLRQRESGKRKEHKPKLLGSDILLWGGGLPREGVGAKMFGMSLETQENQIFRWDIPGSLPGYPAEKLEKSQQ